LARNKRCSGLGAPTLHVSLTVTEGHPKSRVFTFGKYDNFVVGRAKEARLKLSLEDVYVSRHHFEIEVNPPSPG
jgi:hypothetical protein